MKLHTTERQSGWRGRVVRRAAQSSLMRIFAKARWVEGHITALLALWATRAGKFIFALAAVSTCSR